MKIIFFGSDEFAATSLSRLLVNGHEIAAVVTPPDRARGRGMNVSFLPVKMTAMERLIPIFQPEDLKDTVFQQELKGFDADVFVVIAYGKILPKETLEVPRLCCINLHASLLPKYRGAAPINWALINGDHTTGVTVIRMNERMDAGDIIARESVEIVDDTDAQALRERLSETGAECLVQALTLLTDKNFVPEPQNDAEASFAGKLTPDLGCVCWEKSAQEIHNLVRGLVPWPCAHTQFQDRRLKILEAAVFEDECDSASPGTVVKLIPDGIVIACGEGNLLFKRVHPDSAKAMDARSFSVGHRVRAGAVFGQEK